MVEMSLKELFEIGQSFESSVGEGTKGERARIFKNNSRLNLTDEMISFIENIENYKVKLGYFGKMIALEAASLGFSTCWIGGTYNKICT